MIHNLRRKLAEAGKIKIGGLGEKRKAQSGNEYRLPVKHDCFTITGTDRDADGGLVIDQDIMDSLVEHDYADRDGKVRTIPILLHSDEIDEVFPTAYILYKGKRLACRGDGQTAERRNILDGQWTGEVKPWKCPCDLLEADAKGNRRCKPNGTLHCSIRVPGQSVAGSVHRWRTTSRISCEQMVGSLEQILLHAGTLQGLPLVLRVKPMHVEPVGAPPSTVYVCHVEMREQLIVAQRQALEAAKMRRELHGGFTAPRLMLQAPGTEDEDEQDQLGPEFYPDAPGTDRDRDPATDPVVPATLPGVDTTATPLPPTPPPSWDPWRCEWCGEMHTHEPPLCPRAQAGEPPVQPDPDERSTPETGSQEPVQCNDCAKPFLAELDKDGFCPECHELRRKIDETQAEGRELLAADRARAEKPARTRRTKCKGCEQMIEAGGVVKGLCQACRQPEPPQGRPCKACSVHTPLELLHAAGTCPSCTPPVVPPGESPMADKFSPDQRNMLCPRCRSGPHFPASLTLVEGHGLVCGECVVVLGMAGKEPPGFACLGGCGAVVEVEGGKCSACSLAAVQGKTGPPARPAGPDDPPKVEPSARVVAAIKRGTEAGRFTSAEALEAMKADPGVADGLEQWTDEHADKAVALLDGLDCRPVTRP